MRLTLPRIYNAVFIGATLLAPITLTPASALAQDHTYHDKDHNDDHQWNDREDKAYRIWAKEQHRRYVTFDKLKDRDRQSYWTWRHDHDDAKLKIEIR